LHVAQLIISHQCIDGGGKLGTMGSGSYGELCYQ